MARRVIFLKNQSTHKREIFSKIPLVLCNIYKYFGFKF